MFCNRCGTELQPGFHACSNCGRRVGDPVRGLAQSRLEGHLRTLGILWMVIGGLFAIPSLLILLVGNSIHFVAHDHEPVAAVLPIVLNIVGGSLLILAAGGVSVGLGLMQRRPWARIVAIVLGILAIFHPPLGTALGIYTLWVLLPDEHGEEYNYLSRAA